MNQEQFDKVKARQGFIAALDQSGGSTPKALRAYGVEEHEYDGDVEMFDRIHQMRTRIMTSPAFTGDRVLGAILFEDTMDRTVEGKESAEYLWTEKQVVPFLKVDKGLDDEVDGVQIMKPIPGLDDLLRRAVSKRVFGTKMRSVIKEANANGVDAILEQQFAVGKQIAATGLIPILEPEIDIHSATKGEAEALLREGTLKRLEQLGDEEIVMLKLTLPEEPGFYQDLVDHPNVLAVVALSGGYSRDEANDRLSRNPGVIASFSRALTESLTAQQSAEEFDAALDEAIESIYRASIA
jgi:fructose-bisphosphate aldolase class I